MICPNCNKEVEKLTKDHIIPQWLITKVSALGIKMKKKYDGDRIKMICGECNSKKGGAVDYSILEVRQYMWVVTEEIRKKIEEHQGTSL